MGKGDFIQENENPVIPYKFSRFNTIDADEINAVVEVLKSGILSGYVGSWEPAFYGGEKVQEFESNWAEYFSVKHAIAVNSWTSGLICAIGALGISPGDEIIVSPWTMSASATAILHWNAIPVFADISTDDYCINPGEVIAKISSKTRAILAVDIFGQSCNVETLRKIADQHGLRLILDSAQSPGALRNGRFAGTLGDVGGYSLNHHKHIHTGEGGVIVTNSDEIAEKMRLIRNHAEAVVAGRDWTDYTNMIGYNFRMGEIEAAIGIAQLRKFPGIISRRQEIAKEFTEGLSSIKGLQIPKISEGNTHVYYMFPLEIDFNIVSVTRRTVYNMLLAEGVQGLTQGYTNLHLLPMYQKQIAYGKSGFPWSLNPERKYNYNKGSLPVAERLHSESLMLIELCQFEFSSRDIQLTIQAFKKVFSTLKLKS
jgi:dTDP-4-amino-4,6-dideoxygalactose transaminase